MTYTKHTWNAGKAGGTPITAVKLNQMEDGIAAAATTAGVAADVANPESTIGSALSDTIVTVGGQSFARVVNGELRSQMKTDGTDQSATMTAELAALYSAGGGTLVLPSGTVRIDSQITLPNDGAASFRQPPITFIGRGSRQDGQWRGLDTTLGGTVLDLRYSGADAKIVTLGAGLFAAEGVTFADLGTSSTPFILTTNTTLRFRHVSFLGNPSKSGATCDQDAIVLGGSGAISGNLKTSAFQGYGSTFDGITFSRISRGFYGRNWCNSVVFNNCTWSLDCGGSTAIEFDGSSGFSRGNSGTGNLIEMTNYLYGMTFRNSDNNHFYGTSFWDPGVNSITAVLHVGTAGGNEFLSSYGMIDKAISGPGSYIFTSNARAVGTWSADKIVGQPHGVPANSTKVIGAYRSLEDPTDANRQIIELTYDGTLTVSGPTAGTPKVSLSHASAGNLQIDHQSIVRSTGYLRLYAGSATDMIEITRGVLKIGSGTTASRPTISGRTGLHYFDTTLGKPIWSNGTSWVDATGATV